MVKRFKMGKIADQHSDEIYLTDDNPRYENPNKIRRDIKKGIKRKKIVNILKWCTTFIIKNII